MSTNMCRFSDRYYKLIAYYKSIVSEGYVEKHHIIPKCLDGSDSIENLVALPPRAHYLAHYFLWKMHPLNDKIAHAFAMMAVNNQYQHRVLNGKLYELSKLARSNALKGKRISEEVKQRMRKPKSLQHRLKLIGNTNAKGNAGKTYAVRSIEHREKLVNSRRWYDEQRTNAKEERIVDYRKQFIESNMTRKEFALHHNVNYNTMKKYLIGL
jgi:hypothetical protein